MAADPLEPRTLTACSIVLVLLGLSCSGAQGPRGGTPGPAAVACEASAEGGCALARDALEAGRAAIGGTPEAMAEAEARLVLAGPTVARHLVEALGDRDVPVALLAARGLGGVGEGRLATDCCTEEDGRFTGATPSGRSIDEEVCREGASLARQLDELRVDGSWRGTAQPRGGADAPEVRLSLRLQEALEGAEGQLCVNDAVSCHHVEGVRTGRRLELEAGTGGGGTTGLVLAIGRERPPVLRGVLLLPGCRCEAESIASCDCGFDVTLAPGR